MKIVFFINTAAQVHFYKNIIKTLISKGHEIKIMARNYGETLFLLNELGLDYFVYSTPSKNNLFVILMTPIEIFKAYYYLKKFRPQIIIGGGVIDVYVATLLKSYSIGYIDGEPSTSLYYSIQLKLSLFFIDSIVSPIGYLKNLSKNQIRINSYKELAYLHPLYFKPDDSIFNFLELDKKEKFVVLRFGAFDTLSDSINYGFKPEDKIELVKQLERYTNVFISAEGAIPDILKKNIMKIPKNMIHHALYYANLVVADTGTITTESACLGTPTIVMLPHIRRFGNFVELEDKFSLIYCFNNSSMAINCALTLVNIPNLKKDWTDKKNILLNNKINITSFMVWFIIYYPQSFYYIKKYPSFQDNFIIKQESMKDKA